MSGDQEGDQQALSRKYRAWMVEWTQKHRVDPQATRLLAEVADRRAQDLYDLEKRSFGPELEEEIIRIAAQHVTLALHGGPAFDRLLEPAVTRVTQLYRWGVREIFSAEQATFGDQWPTVQAFLDQAFPIGDTHE